MNVRLVAPLLVFGGFVALAAPAHAQTTWASTGGPGGGVFIEHIGFGDSCGVRATVAMKAASGRPAGVFQLQPAGTWTNLLPNEPLFGPFGVSPSYGTGTMFVFYSNGYLRKTTDGGTTWVNPNEAVVNGGCGWANWLPSDIAVEPSDNSIAWAAAQIYAFTEVQGCARTDVGSGLPGGIQSMGPFAIAPSNTAYKYQALQLSGPTQKIWTTSGGSWSDATSNLPSDALVSSIAVAPSDVNLVYLAVGGGQAGKVYHRVSNGNWVGVTPTNATTINQVAVDPTTSVVYAGGNTSTGIAVWSSSDSGNNWTQLTSTGLSGTTVVVMKVGPTGDHVWVGSTDGNLYKYSLGKTCGC